MASLSDGVGVADGLANSRTLDVVDAPFGEFELEGLYEQVTVLAGSPEVVAVDMESSRIVKVNIDTRELLVGPTLNPARDRIAVSPGGDWVYAIGSPGEGRFGPTAVVRRISRDDLSVDLEFEAGSENSDGLPDGRFPEFSFVAGDESRVLLAADDRIAVIEDGIELPASPERQRIIRDVVAFDPTIGYVIESFGVIEFEMDETGIANAREIRLDDLLVPPIRVVDGGIQSGEYMFEVPGFERRLATVLERSTPDPVAPVSYLMEQNSDGRVITIVDQHTGRALTSPQPCPPLSANVDGYQPVAITQLVGDGRVANEKPDFRLPGGIVVTDVFETCGASGDFQATQPSRIFDSRSGQGAENGPGRLVAGTTTTVDVAGTEPVSDRGAQAVVLNVTAVNQLDALNGSNFLTVWPSGPDRPTVSNVSVSNGETIGNQVIVPLSRDGTVDVYTHAGSVHVTVDVMGYFSGGLAESGARFRSRSGVRLLDTRIGLPPLGPGETVDVDVLSDVFFLGYGDESSQVTAVVVNVTVIQPTTRGFVKLFPTGSDEPDASSANFEPGRTTARMVTVPIGADGKITVANAVGEVDLAIDMVGTFSNAEAFVSSQVGRFVGIEPFRFADTRADSPFDGDGRLEPETALVFSGFADDLSVVANLTAVRSDSFGFLTAGPWDGVDVSFGRLATVSSLNFAPGLVVANQVIVKPGDFSEIGIYNSTGNTHVHRLFRLLRALRLNGATFA